ncbi:murein hydrolase activator EnvC family protein [Clostridium perfringens]|uniref:murein hydrolase activator EnvC family protein n=1 Tax=Clostridium perfringens TaxID=1502 RepID=UPI002910E300|nr:peptidoglycan DD-metalloendopeptidase family protein [Clostridium perfringens]EJT6171943.1 peptidoglycan DD-metalloendopeptidase family protein [Clostridium perfringens]EJT6542811.1 peptidoglycan DD-metalloendopeptidase family protein [Clostridium perfringens]EJT6567675.1 peptidoglycan DD-metalloendopeptidase family protein [Clostridium perfringens]MBS5995628.1 peptidoglycan DD-metalloendopeptidase family protein [Clostridium perfringens]MDU5660597.1 peptidoglycan DD-metalloendopeptidase fa
MNKLKIVSLFMSSFLMISAFSAPLITKANPEVNKLQEEKKQITEEKEIKKGKLDEIKDSIDAKQTELNSAQAKVTEYEEKIKTLNNEISSTDSEINKVKKSIEENTTEIEKAKKEQELKQEILGERLRNIYKSNLSDKFLYMILESKNFGELFSNIANIKTLVKTDNKLIEEIEALKNELEVRQAELETSKSTLDRKKAELLSKEKTLNEVKSEHENTLNTYKSQLSELEELEAEKNAELKSLADREDEIEKEIQSYFTPTPTPSTSSTTSNSSSGFIRPVASSSITSSYGPRVHPVTGQYKVHTGVDFAASTGTPFVAAKDGVVTAAEYHPAYGNMVIIDHGGGFSTLYAHASQLKVSVGQKVKQGQVVSLVGSTGYSTGPHAHFEIRINGQHVNPMDYI